MSCGLIFGLLGMPKPTMRQRRSLRPRRTAMPSDYYGEARVNFDWDYLAPLSIYERGARHYSGGRPERGGRRPATSPER